MSNHKVIQKKKKIPCHFTMTYYLQFLSLGKQWKGQAPWVLCPRLPFPTMCKPQGHVVWDPDSWPAPRTLPWNPSLTDIDLKSDRCTKKNVFHSWKETGMAFFQSPIRFLVLPCQSVEAFPKVKRTPTIGLHESYAKIDPLSKPQDMASLGLYTKCPVPAWMLKQHINTPCVEMKLV